jgi:predicted PurR-regulated permease PerM
MAAPGSDPRELPRSVLAVLFILGLTFGCLWILRPFLTELVGATTIAISTWPMLTSLQRKLGGRRGLAIAVMMAGLTIAILAPLYFGAVATAQGVGNLAVWVKGLPHSTLPALPDWLVGIPLLGAKAQAKWNEFTAAGGEGIRTRLAEHSGEILRWLMVRIGNLTRMLIEVLVTLALTGLLYARGDSVGAAMLRFARRLGGIHGENAARLAALATRGVGLGVVLTPLIQAVLGGIGMAVAGVPHVGLFALLVMLSCLAQVGPIPALLIPVLWLYARGAALPATLLLAWAIVVHASGPVVRPLLIKRGVDLPIVLIISGVIGGVAAFGAVGLFIGPVMLAVGKALIENWIAEEGGGKSPAIHSPTAG